MRGRRPYLLADEPSVPAAHRDRRAFVQHGRTVTVAEFDERATPLAAAELV